MVPRRYPGCVLFQSDALSLMFVCVPSSLHLWESKFSFTMAPEPSKCSVYCICAPELSPNFMERAGNVGKISIFHDLSVGNHCTYIVYVYVYTYLCMCIYIYNTCTPKLKQTDR